MSELVNAQAFWKLAEKMGMEPDAFRNKYQLDAPFHALVVVHLDALAAAREEKSSSDAYHLEMLEGASRHMAELADNIHGLRSELDAAREELERSAGHTVEECEADAIQAEYEKVAADLAAAREENGHLRTGLLVVTDRSSLSLEAMSQAIRIASEKTAGDALEYIADYLNGCDAVAEGDPALYQRWLDRGRP